MRPHQVIGSISFGRVAQHVVYGLVGATGPIHFRGDRTGDLISVTLLAMGAFTALTTVYLLFRPAEPRAILGATDEAQMRELLAKYGERDSLGLLRVAPRQERDLVGDPQVMHHLPGVVRCDARDW